MEKLIIFIIFVVFSAIRGSIKAANEKAERERLVQKPADPDRKQRVQSEIESFLAEVKGGNPQQEQAPTQRTAERQERRRRKAEAKRRQEAEQEKQRQQTRRPVSLRAAAAEQESRLSSSVTQHVSEYMSPHVIGLSASAESESGNPHSGSQETGMPSTVLARSGSASAAKAVVALLKDPVGVRNAILVNEILSRPKALRRQAD